MRDQRKTRDRMVRLLVAGWMGTCALAAAAQTSATATAHAASASVTSAALPPTAEAAMGGAAEPKIFPLSQLKRGMKGVAYTVFEGVNPEPMQVEILGVLKDSLGPGRDMILARLYGSKPEFTGVVAGMSGSPVYIDGKLVGALSYRIGQFSKEPIAGITPIEQMLEVRDDSAQPATAQRIQSSGPAEMSVPAANGGLGVEMQAMETPLVFSGFSPETVARFGDRFRAMGMTPVAGLGGADAAAVQPEPLVPGSAVSAVLVRGDLSVAGTCTVTYVDPKRLLACGHPITQYGPVDMPMTKAAVVATLPSPLNAFKIVNTTETVGAFTEDRASAIMGQFGTKARMIPVSVEVVSPATAVTGMAKDKTYRFEVLDNRQLTPSAMLVSVYQSLQGTNLAAAEMSYRMTGEIGVQGLPEVKMSGIVAQNELNPAAINAALFVNDRFSRVYGNPQDQPIVTGMKLKVEGIPERRTATVESARLSVLEANPGDIIDAEVMLRPYQAESKLVRLKVKIPDDMTPGQVRVLVSDGATVDRLLSPSGAAKKAEGLADAVDQMNHLHPNDRIYVTLLSREAQAVLEGQAMPGVPLSMANVLAPLKDAQRMNLNGESVIEAASTEAGYAISGSQVLHLTIR
ncbi:SpoIVB peptidase S55 domain-containing protein [Edaphobacter sp. 12200R-103]|uniref:SpoIVB peptidase S55 domain-containing protein n=1 Tax=Edaphobacter sp. 12200R-103 TaxID=2703788 RepID=UPI001EE4418E|nr:SpoIVB peptidase S55 domain-containing protein [Edaphobacter sp. 12200R-103]